MRKQYYYSDIDENDEIPDDVILGMEDDGYGPDDRIVLDDPEELSDDEEYSSRNIISLLRSELKKMYSDRGILSFKYNGEEYDGIPMAEINPNKFVFEIGDDRKLKSFILSDIVVI